MHTNDALPDRAGPKLASTPPQRMEGDHGFAKYLAQIEPEIAIELARYQEAFPYTPKPGVDPAEDDGAYLYLLITAVFLSDARSTHEWADYVSDYPSTALTSEALENPLNPHVKVRAHYLKHAFSRLLDLVGAPPAMVADAVSILDLHKPGAADVRAAAQAELCKNPGASARNIAKKLTETRPKGAKKVDHSQISKDLKHGALVRPVSRDPKG